jgi:iron complex outermembrane receptor protein
MQTVAKPFRNRLRHQPSILALAVLGAVGLPHSSFAQEGAKLEEVLVTATRRAETDIQSTPIAVTQITADQIDRAVPRDLLDLAMYAPNVSAGKQPGFNSANFAIRGVGQNGIILYYESQVGVTVDDFVIPHIQTANIEMLDIANVEVLRGPQGTLFGKNTTGGVINVKTNRPEMDKNSLDIRGKVAEFGRYESQAVLNLAISDTLAFRAAGMYMKSDGFYKLGAEYGPLGDLGVGYPLVGATGAGDGRDYGGDDVFSGRFKLRWQPTDDLDINLAYEVVRDRGDAPPSINGTPDGAYLFNALGLTRDSGDQIRRAAISGRNDVLIGMNRGHEIDVDGLYLNIDWAINEDYTLTAFAGRRETESWLPSTYTGEVGPVSLFDANRQDERETTQIEVRLASDLDGPFNWVVGGFYQKDDTVFSVAQVLGFVDMTLPSEAIFGDPFFFNNNPQVLSNAQDAEAYAVFADGTWDITEKLSFGAGIRYTSEKKQWTGRNQVFTFGLDPTLTWQQLGEPLAAADFNRYPTGVVRDNETWNEPTYRATLGYQFNDNVYGYATYSRGFKSGGYNDQTGTGGNPIEPLQARPTEPETADSFEIGIRSELFDNRLRLNATAFSVVYDDSQQQLLATIAADRDGDGVSESTFQETRFFNAAKIEVSGVEFEGAWLVTEQFTVQGSLGLLDAEFDSFQADTDFDGAIDTDLSGNEVARAPDMTWNLDFLYSLPMSSGALDFALNVNYEDEAVYAYTAVADTPDGVTDERTLVNASVTYTSADDRWWVRAYGRNLTDKEYRIGELPVANLWVMSYYGEPQTIGIEGGMRLDW